MVELQSFKDCDFTLASGDNCDKKLLDETHEVHEEEEASDEMLSNDLKHSKQQLVEFLAALNNQKERLQNTFNLLKGYSSGKYIPIELIHFTI